MCHVSPEIITAVGDAVKGVVAALGAIVATVTSAVAAYYTWRTRSQLGHISTDIIAINAQTKTHSELLYNGNDTEKQPSVQRRHELPDP